jgi:hypothetical protein
MELPRVLNVLRIYFNLHICLSGKSTCKLAVPFMLKSPYYKMQFEHRKLATSKAGSEIL